ncbi:MAG: hypothetical protein NPIRA02_23970 [Nitrospirales bacterium]|nr:MAG: hypothetical protein NPIRA02_23970 [Nitrospirales bacterium]
MLGLDNISLFFSVALFRPTDIQYVAHSLGWPRAQVQATAYAPETQSRHRQLIRTLCHFRVWDC